MGLLKALLIATCFFFCHKAEAAGVCTNGDLRAVEANITHDPQSGNKLVTGRVQLCILNQWSDVCSTDAKHTLRWHQVDQDVACKQLRNENATITASSPSSATYTIGVTGCFGHEGRLVDCSLLIERSCGSRNALVEYCSVTASQECSNGDIDARNGQPLKICEDGRWNYLCGRLWGDSQATVVCRQNRMPAEGAIGDHIPSPGGLPTLMVHYTCTGAEDDLADCPLSSLFVDIDCSVVARVNCKILGHHGKPENINVTSLSSTVAQVSWVLKPNISSDLFIITCNSSTHNTVSLSGTLQSVRDPQSDGVHTATVSGLDPDTLYTCCVAVRDEDVGSSLQQCANTYLPALDGVRGTFDRGSNDSIIMPCPDLVTTEAIECPSTNIIISIQTSTVTTTILKTVSPNMPSSDQRMSRTLVQNRPAGSTGSANGAANCLPSSASQFTHTQPVTWEVGIVIGMIIGVVAMITLLSVALIVVLIKLRIQSARKNNGRGDGNTIMEISNPVYTSRASTDTLSEKQQVDEYMYVSTSMQTRRNVYDSVPRSSISSYTDVGDENELVPPDEYIKMR